MTNDTQPILTPMQCIYCEYEWEALFPDGMDDDEKDAECPKCGRMGGHT